MIINQANIAAVTRTLKSIFNQALQSDPTGQVIDRIMTEVPSAGAQNDYTWLGDIPEMREWLGERQYKDLMAYTYAIENKTWESSISVKREHFEDDQTWMYKAKIQELAMAYFRLKMKLVTDLLNNGFAAACFDGEFFFDDDHPTYDGSGGTWTNLAGAALDETSLLAGVQAMESLVSDQSIPIDVMPDLLIVPPALRYTAKELVKNEYKANGESNPLYQEMDYIVLPRLSSATAWFLADTKHAVKGLIFQSRTKLELIARDKADDDNVFEHDEYRYGTRVRCNAGYGLPYFMYGSTGAA